ncbi:MAG: hypothetical protein HY472_00455 [Candidatus Sungbacteria bacterium]|nr:hypothetical protein [Candidatus Sungbacteria bacterium]
MKKNEAPRASPWHPPNTVTPEGAHAERNPAPEEHSSTGKPVIWWGVDDEHFLLKISFLCGAQRLGLFPATTRTAGTAPNGWGSEYAICLRGAHRIW